jgi:hypothetical protein
MQVQINKIVITLTTVPQRLNYDVEDGFKLVLKSICEQNYDNYEVHLNIPTFYKVTGEEYVIPNWLVEYNEFNSKLKIFRTEDFGPTTKIIPTINRLNPDDLIIVVDDDLVYHHDMINEHIKYHNQLPNSALFYDGRDLVGERYNDLRDSWIICVNKPTRISGLFQHYKSASYFKKYFKVDFFTDFLGKTKSDDILITYYFKFKKIKMFVIPYEPDNDKISNYNDWYNFQGVTTFPVLRHSNSLGNTGCSHPKMLENEPRFFVPQEFKYIDNLPLD